MRANPTQVALEAAGELRAYSAAILTLETREAIPPLYSRHLDKLAALVIASPCAANRRARRSAFDNRRDCH
jgi:hypothetical protein